MNKIFPLTFLFVLSILTSSYGQKNNSAPDSVNILTIERVTNFGPEYDLIKPLVGNWEVTQRVWTKPGGAPVTLPPYKASRKLTGHFLEEIMEPKPDSDVKPFTRLFYLNYNNANLQWESIVLDTRYPVMMFETSVGNAIENGNTLTMYLPAFVMAPGWGDDLSGRLGKERRTIFFETNDKTVVKQYWTLPAGKEFLAIEYVYTRIK